MIGLTFVGKTVLEVEDANRKLARGGEEKKKNGGDGELQWPKRRPTLPRVRRETRKSSLQVYELVRIDPLWSLGSGLGLSELEEKKLRNKKSSGIGLGLQIN